MRIHDIELHNVRKLDSLSITGLSERGVIVISGDNESGKSTIADAIHVALTAKWNSSKREAVSLINPASREKPHVKLRLELDGYEFTLDKVFGNTKGSGTVITVHRPSPATYRNDDAENWLNARMAAADTNRLWDVFVAKQGEAQATLSLGGYTTVTSALQSASGQRAETTEEVGLFEAVERNYTNYYSRKKGTARNPLKDVDAALKKAEEAHAAAAERIREFDDLNTEAARNEELQAKQQAALPEAVAEVERWTKALAELREFQGVVTKAEDALAAATQQLEAAKGDKQDREDLIAQFNAACDEALTAQREVAELKEKADAETEQLRAVRERRDVATAAYRDARQAEELATAEVALGQRRTRVELLSERVTTVSKLREQLAAHKEVLNRSLVTDEDLEKLLACQREVATAAAILEASSPKVELSATSAQQIVVDGAEVDLEPGAEALQRAVTEPLAIEIGDVTVTVEPGDGSDSQQRKLNEARLELTKQLDAAGVADVKEAQESNIRRREAERAKFQVEASIKAESGGVDYHQLAEELEEATAAVEVQAERYHELAGADAPEVIELSAAKERLADAVSLRKKAEEERDGVDKRLSALEKRPAYEKYTEAASAAVGLQSTLSERVGMLDRAREKASDAEVFVTVENREKDFRLADAQLVAAKEELNKLDRDDVEASLAGAQQWKDSIEKNLVELKERRQSIDVHLEYFESANEQLAAAESTMRLAKRDWESKHRQANAAKTLYEAMTKARAATRNALAKPLLRKLDEYGGSVFGTDTAFTMDDNLKIMSRSNQEGVFTVEELSGGAQEQLDILLRLAAAGVMEGGQGAPVIIDDALGYSDEERLRLMNNALSKAGKEIQVIVLTCDEHRFIRTPGMKHLRIQDLLKG